ncbi:response regulator transcription factor [Sulfurospirillum arcachonense]|uniref:response regulator transcription factor n=1 Tax=Sulfurospirillum arcachonense TaxID=57666 RepID=UPI0004689DC7|nr:response regulator transcription factor [Sulfurospirillum arcachonense]
MNIYKAFAHFRLLYVEDDSGVREVNLRFLNRMFHTVYSATNGENGYAQYLKYKPDIIITDLKMPILDGIGMVKRIRESDNKTKIIITTAFTDEEQLINAVELNIVRYVVKPLNQRNLLPALEKAIKELGQRKKIAISSNVYLDIERNVLFFHEKEYHLTKKEFLFLELLGNNTNRTISYSEIESYIWDEEPMSMKSLRTMVGSIRKRFHLEELIRNVSGLGYILRLNNL